VLRAPTAEGAVFLKVNAPGFAHEAAVVSLLAPLAPALLPELLAVDLDRGWMLLADAGTCLVEQRVEGAWLDVLPRYADLQLAAVDLAEGLVAAGVPDLRLERLPEMYARLGGRDVGGVEALCGELAPLGLPETIQHDDLRDG